MYFSVRTPTTARRDVSSRDQTSLRGMKPQQLREEMRRLRDALGDFKELYHKSRMDRRLLVKKLEDCIKCHAADQSRVAASSPCNVDYSMAQDAHSLEKDQQNNAEAKAAAAAEEAVLLREQVAGREVELQEMTAAKGEIANKLQEARMEAHAMKQQVWRLQKQLQNNTEQVAEMQQVRDTLYKSLETYKVDLAQSERHSKKLGQELAAAKSTNQELQRRLEEAIRAKHIVAQEMKDKLQLQKANLQKELTSTRESLSNAVKRAESSERQAGEQAACVVHMQSQLAEQQEALQEKQQLLEEAIEGQKKLQEEVRHRAHRAAVVLQQVDSLMGSQKQLQETVEIVQLKVVSGQNQVLAAQQLAVATFDAAKAAAEAKVADLNRELDVERRNVRDLESQLTAQTNLAGNHAERVSVLAAELTAIHQIRDTAAVKAGQHMQALQQQIHNMQLAQADLEHKLRQWQEQYYTTEADNQGLREMLGPRAPAPGILSAHKAAAAAAGAGAAGAAAGGGHAAFGARGAAAPAPASALPLTAALVPSHRPGANAPPPGFGPASTAPAALQAPAVSQAPAAPQTPAAATPEATKALHTKNEHELVNTLLTMLHANPHAAITWSEAQTAGLNAQLVPLDWATHYSARYGSINAFMQERPAVFAQRPDGAFYKLLGAEEMVKKAMAAADKPTAAAAGGPATFETAVASTTVSAPAPTAAMVPSHRPGVKAPPPGFGPASTAQATSQATVAATPEGAKALHMKNEHELVSTLLTMLHANPHAAITWSEAQTAGLNAQLVPFNWATHYSARYGTIIAFMQERPAVFAQRPDGAFFKLPGAEDVVKRAIIMAASLVPAATAVWNVPGMFVVNLGSGGGAASGSSPFERWSNHQQHVGMPSSVPFLAGGLDMGMSMPFMPMPPPPHALLPGTAAGLAPQQTMPMAPPSMPLGHGMRRTMHHGGHSGG